MNTMYVKDISNKQKLSLQERSNNSRHIASTPTYRYKLVIKYYNEGMQMSEITRTLEKEKYPAPSIITNVW